MLKSSCVACKGPYLTAIVVSKPPPVHAKLVSSPLLLSPAEDNKFIPGYQLRPLLSCQLLLRRRALQPSTPRHHELGASSFGPIVLLLVLRLAPFFATTTAAAAVTQGDLYWKAPVGVAAVKVVGWEKRRAVCIRRVHHLVLSSACTFLGSSARELLIRTGVSVLRGEGLGSHHQPGSTWRHRLKPFLRGGYQDWHEAIDVLKPFRCWPRKGTSRGWHARRSGEGSVQLLLLLLLSYVLRLIDGIQLTRILVAAA
mmetsp:Transcript_76406/g.149740  ORF Transcript_76406/g.149740 Transcript_76406/m.149740 type:complete len:255 (-) Transcript_76406:549-1313(-)